MIYIYDILLNWCKEKAYDFYEWEKSDKLIHIKRMPVFKIEKNILKDFYYKKIKLDESFISKIFNLTESYLSKKVEKIPYACLLCDGISVLAIMTDEKGNVKYKSKLIIDEEDEILCLCQRLNKTNISYSSGSIVFENDFLTRKERNIKSCLVKVINESYKKNKKDKLSYLYYEYFGKEENDIKKIYNEMIKSLDNIDENHKKIYNLLQLITSKN